MKAICWGCDKAVGVRPARGGDGSAVIVSKHPRTGPMCKGSYRTLDLAEVLGEETCGDTGPGSEHGYPPLEACTRPKGHEPPCRA